MPMTPSQRKKIFEIINEEFPTINDKVPMINRGGCGVFAERTFTMLKELGFAPKIAVLTRHNKRKQTEFGVKNNLGAKLTPFDHVIIIVGRKYIDSTGVYNEVEKLPEFDTEHVLLKGIPHFLLKSWIREKNIWNKKYKPQKYNAPLRKEITKIGQKLTVQI